MARFRIEDHPRAAESDDGKFGVEYLINPAGVLWAVPEDHYAIPLAEKRDEGWRLASDDEIRAHAKETGDWLPPELGESKRGPGRPSSSEKGE